MKKTLLLLTVIALLFLSQNTVAQTYHQLSSGAFLQDWSNAGLITVNNDWTGVPSIIGYRGDTATSLTNVDPQKIINASYSTVLNVTANQSAPNTNTSGGIAEFEITNPVVALQGSGTADAPNLVVYLDATGCTGIHVKFNVRDIDGSADNSAQQFSLQYRIGNTGDFVNIPSGYIADATSGPSLAILVTSMDVTLPVDCENKSELQIRFMTTNATGSDEWIGIDDINISKSSAVTPTITVTAPVSGNQWAQGSTHNITWTAIGTNTNVKIDYTGDASATTPIWENIDTVAAISGTYSAQIPADLAPGDLYRIRITDIPETTFGLSDIFSIMAAPAPIATFVPSDGATNIGIASDIIITFDVPVRKIDNTEISGTDLLSLVTLKTTDASGTVVPFTATIDAAKKVITINPDADLVNEQLYYVAIDPVEGLSDNTTVAESATFTTAASLAPAISDVTIAEVAPYYAGDLVTIKWVSKNVTDVKIEAWIPSESKWDVIIPITPSDGIETFIIPIEASYSTDYKIRITDLANAAVSAESSIFTIIGAISEVKVTEIAPYFAGDAIQVNWVAKNIPTVKIELFDPATSSWSDLVTGVSAADGNKIITLPATLAYSTAYKVRVSDEALDSKARTESGVFEVDAVAGDLKALRAQPVGAIVKFTGTATVTFVRTYRNQKYLQDGTAAIVIDDPTTAPGFITGTYAAGDGITNIVGKMSLYSGLIEFTPTKTTGEPATGIVIVPEVRTLASLTAADQCKLIKIENFAFLTPTQYDVNGKFPITSKSYDIEGIDKALMVYRTLFTEANYLGGYVPVGPISSVVLVGQFNAQMQITARSWSDMTVPIVADFDADKTFALTGENVTFMDMSGNHPTSWEWTFTGGTPATSTEQNPVVTYSAPGTYSVTLKATNAAGGNSIISKTNFFSIGVVGISSQSSTVSVYPNPTNGRLFITNPSKDAQEITVFSSIGKQVNSSVSADGIISLDIKSQTKGMYLIRITNKNTKSVQVKKVVLY